MQWNTLFFFSCWMALTIILLPNFLQIIPTSWPWVTLWLWTTCPWSYGPIAFQPPGLVITEALLRSCPRPHSGPVNLCECSCLRTTSWQKRKGGGGGGSSRSLLTLLPGLAVQQSTPLSAQHKCVTLPHKGYLVSELDSGPHAATPTHPADANRCCSEWPETLSDPQQNQVRSHGRTLVSPEQKQTWF